VQLLPVKDATVDERFFHRTANGLILATINWINQPVGNVASEPGAEYQTTIVLSSACMFSEKFMAWLSA